MARNQNKNNPPNKNVENAENEDIPDDESRREASLSSQQIEVTLKNALDHHSATMDAKLESLNRQSSLKNAETKRAISKLSDLVTGLSLEMVRIFAKGSGIDPGGTSGNKELIGIEESENGSKGEPSFPYYTRLTKIDFPKFWGDEIKSWLFRVEQFFLTDVVEESMKVRLAALHPEGKALQWHQAYVKTRQGNLPPWEEYVADITNRFGEDFDDPMAELVQLKQTGTVREYHDAFDSLLNRVTLDPAHALSCFIAGLDDEVQYQVRLGSSKTLK